MKLNVFFPVPGCQKLTEVYDEGKLCTFYEKCVAREVTAHVPGEEWVGYLVRISSRNDRQGFPMKWGVPIHGCLPAPGQGSFLLTDQGLEKKTQMCLGLHCGCRSEHSELGQCKKRRELCF